MNLLKEFFDILKEGLKQRVLKNVAHFYEVNFLKNEWLWKYFPYKMFNRFYTQLVKVTTWPDPKQGFVGPRNSSSLEMYLTKTTNSWNWPQHTGLNDIFLSPEKDCSSYFVCLLPYNPIKQVLIRARRLLTLANNPISAQMLFKETPGWCFAQMTLAVVKDTGEMGKRHRKMFWGRKKQKRVR